jgi:hypothetical protein
MTSPTSLSSEEDLLLFCVLRWLKYDACSENKIKIELFFDFSGHIFINAFPRVPYIHAVCTVYLVEFLKGFVIMIILFLEKS